MMPELALARESCRSLSFLGGEYTVCTFDPAKDDIRIFNKDGTGNPYGSFEAIEQDLKKNGKGAVKFAVNGGMYHEDRSPVGLYIERGVEKHPLVTGQGWGNFFLLPNGVFYIRSDGKSAGVMETGVYSKSELMPLHATQSGPMLVIGGKLHPAFLPFSDSLKIRNGVGVDKRGKVIFVTSENPVRFFDFGLLYKDILGCPNALFLDGSISSLDIPAWGRRDNGHPLGPIIAVTGDR